MRCLLLADDGMDAGIVDCDCEQGGGGAHARATTGLNNRETRPVISAVTEPPRSIGSIQAAMDTLGIGVCAAADNREHGLNPTLARGRGRVHMSCPPPARSIVTRRRGGD